jgi:F0F1-type ATP synthase membrane subunit a
VAELTQRGLWALALAVLVMNLPFGFWRAGAKRFTRPWFVAVHAPVPFVIFLRIVSGLGWHLVSFPVLIGAFFTGQFLGGAIRRRR